MPPLLFLFVFAPPGHATIDPDSTLNKLILIDFNNNLFLLFFLLLNSHQLPFLFEQSFSFPRDMVISKHLYGLFSRYLGSVRFAFILVFEV
jgi:hypothetical protein